MFASSRTYHSLFKKLCLFKVLGVMCLCVLSPQAQAVTIEDAIQKALKKHPSIEAAKAFIASETLQIDVERSNYFPEFNASLSAGRLYGDNATTRGLSVERGSGYSGYGEGTSSLVQPLFDGFGTRSRIQTAKARVRQADMQLLNVREDLALRTAESYIDVMRTHTALVFIRNHLDVIDIYLGKIKTATDEGVIDEAQYHQAIDVKYILQDLRSVYEGQALSAEARYREATGTIPNGDMIAPPSQRQRLVDTVDDMIGAALESHPSIKAAKFSAEALKHEIETEYAALYPGISSEFSYLQSDRRELLGGEIVDARAVLRMNWRFETGGGLFDRVEKKRSELSEAIALKSETLGRLEGEIRQAYAEMQTYEQRLDNINRRHALNENMFRTLAKQFEAARVTMLQVLQADNQLFNIKLEKLNTEYGLLSAQYRVLASMGQLQKIVQTASRNKP